MSIALHAHGVSIETGAVVAQAAIRTAAIFYVIHKILPAFFVDK
jgi:hypothetical protein